MTRKKQSDLDSLSQRIGSLADRDVDLLYGLEPVYEPGAIPSTVRAEEFVAIRCPYCGERLDVSVDLSAGARSYIEDCQVCCRPMELSIELAANGALQALQVRRLD
jgi:hypothetical protein